MPKTLHLSVELAPVWASQQQTRFSAHLMKPTGDIEHDDLMRNRFALTVETGSAVVHMRPTVQQARSVAALLLRMAAEVEAEEAAALVRAMGAAA